uniref:Uncharacterized protein n=1 Tax=Fagus sylvatica TaxID=28930 RepID=A0A2N9GXY4_FAGSY
MRCRNRYADALATLGSQISFEGPKVDVTINKRSKPITDLLKEEFEEQHLDAEDWRTPIKAKPIKAKLMSPKGVADLKTLKDYVLIAGDLYRRLPGGVLARYVSLREAAKKLTKVHERSCEFSDGLPSTFQSGLRPFPFARQLVQPWLTLSVNTLSQGWSSHLADALWAYRGSTKTATGFTPFSLVYGTDAIAPIELLVPSPRILHGMNLEVNADICAEAKAVDLESLEEAGELAQARSLRYHQKLASAYGKTLQTRIFAKG